jgi:hypothetical protein
MKSKFYNKNYNKYLIFILFLVIGLIVYDDYGFNIDEKFHRSNGFYWLNYIAEYFNLEQLAHISKDKLLSIRGFTLSPIEHYNKYGIIFDVPAAIIEILFELELPVDYYQMRHLLVFFYFYIGLIFFYKILLNRFKKDEIALAGVVLLLLTPRILGDSFQNVKDIVFLTFVIISSFYYFKTIDNLNKRNIILFSLFSAICVSVRMFGVFFPISFVVFCLLSLKKNNYQRKINYIILYLITCTLFLILIWPLLWENTLENLLSYFEVLGDYFNSKVLFLDNYYSSKALPYSYLPIWILISTPILHLILFVLGFSIMLARFFKRYVNIKNNSIYDDFWRSKNEKKDFFIFFNFIGIFLGIIFFDIKQYNSWRMAYFLYFFIIYFGIYYINVILIKFRNINLFCNFIMKFVFFSLVLLTIIRIIIYHPYQSLYFNILTPNNIKNSVEVDYTGLSSIHFLNDILVENSNKNIIKIGVASWYPLWRMIELLNSRDNSRIKIVGNKENSSSDYIYSNRISDVDKNHHKKYDIPANFTKYKELVIDGAIIYEVYKQK